ncbi:hypothetical protein [Bradyrhizobium vignae]|uniref:hypothetical protein n=1 Tax=Bradyrhizobium vignae TaxID=1549949 RepID=UPI00100B72C5|nr:hypothetical protein [Bradyrhizobium vignae]RXH05191.1 hypothetical protein EAV90_07290 [Bradyrhizobium vignae]
MTHRYNQLAEQWRSVDDELTRRRMAALVAKAEELTPESITGVMFQISCALSEMNAIVDGSHAPQIRLVAERRVLRLLRRAACFLDQHSDDLPAAWTLAVPAAKHHLRHQLSSSGGKEAAYV